MKKLKFNIAALILVFVTTPMSAQAGTDWTLYKPGLVSSAISNGETVLLGFLTSW